MINNKQYGAALAVLGWLFSVPAFAQNKPAWVDQPQSVYPAPLYVSAVGSGRDRAAAENGAKAALAAYFRQSISSKVTIADTERQVNGRSVSSSSNMSQSIEAASSLENLMGLEIKETWNDTRGKTWWAVAVMEKGRGRERYGIELTKMIGEINALINVSGGIGFETIARCRSAAEMLPRAEGYALVLSMLDGPDRQGELSRLAAGIDSAATQAKNIPVDLRISGDQGGRIRAAFAQALTAQGFRTGNRNSRYALDVKVELERPPRSAYFNARYVLDAVLIDTKNGAELFTYNAADRESHPGSQGEADSRAMTEAAKRAAEEFPGVLKEYLDSR